MAQYDFMDYGVAYDPEEERKRREEEAKKAGETPVATTEKTVYQDGSQTHTTTQEIPAPGFGDRLGQAVSQAGTNFVNNVRAAPERFVNNLNQGIDNIRQAPDRFMQNMQAIPGQMQQRMAPGPVAPGYTAERNDAAAVDAQMRAQQAQQAPQAQQAAPQAAAPAPDQAAYTRQQESGGNYNIGYHFPANAQGQRQSTAAGPYGFTAASVQDIARQDPSLNKPIEQWTRQDHDRAYAIKTQQNGNRLGQLGVEATPGALQVAHLLGADGAARFLQTGEVSEAAAKANGGAERLKQIAQGRYAGAQAPASGATQQPPAQPAPSAPSAPVSPYSLATGVAPQGLGTPQQRTAPAPQPDITSQAINRYQTIQDKPDELMKFAFDANTPDYLKQRAKDQIVEGYDQQKKEAEAQKAMANLTPNDVAKAMTKKSEGNSVGDWLQYLLFKHVGLTDMANQKGEQLGIGHKWATAYIQDETGRDVPVEVQTSASGKLLKGVFAGTGEELKPAQLTQAAGAIQNADNLKTAQTQATHAYSSAYTSLMKQRDAFIQNGATDPDLVSRGLDMGSIQTRAQQAGKAVIDAARTQYRPQGGATAVTAVTANTPGYAMVNGELVNTQTADQAIAGKPAMTSPAGATGTPQAQYKTESGKPSILENWSAFRPNESAKAKEARSAIQPNEIDSAAQALVEGRVKPTEFTGRGSEFRRLATERALELDSKYTPMRYDQVNAVVKRYTSGKDHETLLNTGTAVNHLAQFKDIAQNTPGNTNVSSWNTFYQNLTKYGNAPELKSKEAMAGFVAGELVKAASGGHGSMTERTHLEGQLMKANTPAEIVSIVDNSIKLAHGRYSTMKSSYEGSTGRKDFDQIVGMPEEARREFGKIEGHEAIKNQGSAAEKWARNNPNDPRSADILKRLGKQ